MSGGIRLAPVTWALSVALAALVAGAAIGLGYAEVGLGICGVVLLVALIPRLELRGWCLLIVLFSVGIRAPVAIFSLPSSVNFAHYPLVLAFVFVAWTRRRRPADRSSAPARWLLWLIVIALASALINVSHPTRALLFLLIVGEPLLLLLALDWWGGEAEKKRRDLRRILIGMLLLQVPIALLQGLLIGWQDPVQGTLVGHGAGAHVLGGLFALGLFALIGAMTARVVGLAFGVCASVGCFAMMAATGALQVVIIAGLLLAVSPFLIGISSRAFLGRPRIIAIAALSLLFALGGLVLAELVVPTVLDRAQDLALGREIEEVRFIRSRWNTDKIELLVGSGPGTSASRASLLLTPQLLKEDSPLKFLELPPTEAGLDFAAATVQSYGGSAEAVASSALGILGDLGLVGIAASAVLLVKMWQYTTGTWLAIGVRLALAMTAALSFVDSWIEFPEYTIPLACLIFLARTPGTTIAIRDSRHT